MKLINIRIPSGYKMLDKDFEINFLTKTRVDKESSNDSLIELENDFYYPVETTFIGKNSSGKTTTLVLIMTVFSLLENGRIMSEDFNDGDVFDLEVVFYSNGKLYKYIGKYKKDSSINRNYLVIVDEWLGSTTIKANYKKDLSNACYEEEVLNKNIDGDTSEVFKFGKTLEFNLCVDNFGYTSQFFGLYYKMLGEDCFMSLLHLFDDSVESISPHNDESGRTDGYFFKRKGSETPIVVTNDYLEKTLSRGTLRGINLYGLSILAFKSGGTVVVDEIEKSFNRNLIENLFIMFNDKTINKKNASIIYSTHYSELLDLDNRCDNVNVLHRDGNSITLKNMCSDYKHRTDMLKSTQFNQNAFDTLINYDRLMELKRSIR